MASILLIEDETVDAELVRRSLAAGGCPSRLHHAPSLAAGLDLLAQGGVDVVLLDLNLPDSRGVDTVLRLREQDLRTPVVAFTARGDDETAAAALAAGVQDYVVKDDLNGPLLRRSIRCAMERRRLQEEDRRFQARAQQADKLESLSALSAGIGFGMNPLIGEIFDHCDDALAALDGSGDPGRIRGDLLEIHRAAFRAGEVVQRLRDYAGQERAASGAVDLASFAIEATDFLSTIVSPEIHVACGAPGGPLFVEANRPELHRLLVSLVVNAAEAIGAKRGSIAISTGMLEARAEDLVGSHGWPDPRPGCYAVLRVADTGQGLPAVRRERLFDPFYTTKLAGRGLGLSSVIGILRRRRALVRLDPNHPIGTIVTVLFPRRAEPADDSE
jgi:signal transduction histidine kinase